MEFFKKINEYENYSISNFGNVRNDLTGKILKSRIHNHGYLQITLLGKNKYIHRLVAEAFCENENVYPYVDHIDQNKKNNHYLNLRWITHSNNMRNINKKEGTTSRYLGVSYHKKDKKWRTRISINNKVTNIGFFKTEEEAHNAFRNFIVEHNLESFYPNDEK